MMVVGGLGVVTPVLFPNAENLEIMWPHMIVQFGLQLFVYLPTYLLASYYRYKHRQVESNKWLQNTNNQTKTTQKALC